MHTKIKTADQLTISHFWQTSKQHKKLLYLCFLMPVASFMLYTVAPFMVGKILAGMIDQSVKLTPYVIGFIIAGMAGIVANRIGFRALFKIQPMVMRNLQFEALQMLLNRGTSFHNNQVSGRLVSDANEYPEAYNNLSNAFFMNILSFSTIIVTGLIVIAFNSPLLGLVMFAMTAVVVGSGVKQRRQMAEPRQKRIAANKAVTSHLSDVIVNNQAVKTFALETVELKRHSRLAKTLEDIRIENWARIANQGSDRITFLMAFQLVFVMLIIYLVRRDPSLAATGIFAFSYTITLTNRLFDIGNILRTTEEALQRAEPITLALQEDFEVREAPDAGELTISTGRIVFDAVGFHYHDSSKDNQVFKDLELVIEPGQKIGLVGPSGGGKSTITKLLLRFEDVQEGSISIDDQNIASVTQQSLRRAIAYVPQESLLFHRTIRDNIIYGKDQATEEEIIKAAKDAHAHDFIMELQKGYDTVVGERGVKLSGGQRQRVAIARALLKDAPILVLDEATSALDSESETAIQAALWRLMQGRTALVIAHRLSTIQRMDRIIVMDNGRIIEDGTHRQLLELNGMYARLWGRQSGGFIDD